MAFSPTAFLCIWICIKNISLVFQHYHKCLLFNSNYKLTHEKQLTASVLQADEKFYYCIPSTFLERGTHWIKVIIRESSACIASEKKTGTYFLGFWNALQKFATCKGMGWKSLLLFFSPWTVHSINENKPKDYQKFLAYASKFSLQ